jgi:hypothetical protein
VNCSLISGGSANVRRAHFSFSKLGKAKFCCSKAILDIAHALAQNQEQNLFDQMVDRVLKPVAINPIDLI